MFHVCQLLLLSVFVCACVVVGPSMAMLSSDAGRNDWRIQLFGTVEYAAASEDGKSPVFVATRDGVFGAVKNDQQGSLLWRHELPNEEIFGIARCSSDSITILSTNAIRRWSRGGVLLLDSALQTPITLIHPTIRPSLSCTQDGGVIATTPSSVFHMGSSGSIRWNIDATTYRTIMSSTVTPDGVFVAELDNNFALVSLFSAVNGLSATNSILALNNPAEISSCALSYAHIACCSSGLLNIALYDANINTTDFVAEGACTSVVSLGNDLIALKTTKEVSILRGGKSVKSFPVNTVVTVSNGNLFALAPTSQGHVLSAHSINALNDAPSYSATISDLSSNGASLLSVSSGASIVRLVDETLVYLVDGKIRWTRPEFLRNIVATSFADFIAPAADFPLFETNVFAQLKQRLTSQMSSLATWFSPSSDPDVTSGARDAFNLHQRIVSITSSGVLAGLDSVDGRVAWHVSPFGADSSVTHANIVPLHADGLSHPIYALVATLETGATSIILFDPLTGTVESTVAATGDVIAYGAVALKGHSHTTPLLVLTRSGDLTVYPHTAETLAAVQAHVAQHHTVLYSADPITGVFEGFLISTTDKGLNAQSVWRIVLDPNAAKIVAMTTRHPMDRIASLGDIIPDGKVLYKYLSPHLIGVATLTPTDPREGSVLTITIIDTIKGSIVERVQHVNAQGPVYMVHADNWFVYSYRDRKNRRWLLNTVDLFDSAGKPPSTGLSSLQLSRPIVVQQAYVFPHAITHLGVTVTDASVANRAIIIATSVGKVFAVSDRFLDARRPVGATSARTEDQVPYHPMLSVDPSILLTYNHSVNGVSSITCAPTALESTSLMFASGLDAFLTQVAPSKKFDSLSADFNKPVLLASLAAMIAATFVARWRWQTSALKTAWA